MVSAPVQYSGDTNPQFTEVWKALNAAVASGGNAIAGDTESVTDQSYGVAATAAESDVKPGKVDREVTGCYYCVPVEEEEPISTTKARSNAESAAECFLENRNIDAPILYDDISAIVKQWKCKRNKKRKRIHPIGDQWFTATLLVWSGLLPDSGQLALFPNDTQI